MRMKVIIATLATLLLIACSPDGLHDSGKSFRPPVETLAKVVAVELGGHSYHFPLVAVTRAGFSRVERLCGGEGPARLCAIPLRDLAAISSTQRSPISVSRIAIELEGYSSFKNTKLDRWFEIPHLCGKLTQSWARRQCADQNHFKDNLRGFTLIEASALAGHSLGFITGQRESVNVAVQRMNFKRDDPSVDCGPDARGLCSVAMPIGQRALAVWVVGPGNSTTDSINRQAAAIRAFLKHAVGAQEDYKAFIEALNAAN
ncbi:hypothetical protein SAMN06265795_11693 [Noviherbaspirillum humi]|uniref:Uncharacterized protein n=1 Tax=Noviherbaspirillum humi TaxID=1688639 RepID=A0A239KMI1_9BURK|nr:hypothetical protein SAMN06265795_11693 [Noviherbaspirillum humi]